MKFRNTMDRGNSKRQHTEGEVLAYERNRRIQYRVVDSAFAGVIEYRLETHGDKAQVQQVLDVLSKNLIAKVFFVVAALPVRSQSRKILVDDLARLKHVVESGK